MKICKEFLKTNRNFLNSNKYFCQNNKPDAKKEKETETEHIKSESSHDHDHHHHHKHHESKGRSFETPFEEIVENDLPNINTTKPLKANGTNTNTINNKNNDTPSLSSLKKIHGNMLGMERIDEYTQTTEVSKDLFKDESKSSKKSSRVDYTFRGNLNTDDSPPPEKDITDESKKL